MNFILIHGAFHGGWCWAETATELSKHGARVYAPSLTGLGDRRHLFSPSINLATHVQDVINLIEYEQLDNCILVGHSYAGSILAGVGDRLRERVAHYIFVDASVPPPGTTTWGWACLNPHLREDFMAMIDGPGNGLMIPPFPATAFGLTDPAQIASVATRLTPMPRGCYTDPIQLENGGVEGLTCSYIAANAPAYGNMRKTVEWISASPDWTLLKIDTCHDMMVTEPEKLADMLLGLVGDA